MRMIRKKTTQRHNIERYSWESFDRDVRLLVEELRYDDFKPKSIVCIAVGGLPLGAKLRNLLNIPLTIVSTASYTGMRRLRTLTLNASYVVPISSPVLLVDDIADTGRTLKVVKEHLELGGILIKTATLFYKETSIIKPDYYIHKTDKWVIFPWEV